MLDDLEVTEVLHESRVTLLYRVRAVASGQDFVPKTLRSETDAADAAALAHEEWLARRVASADFPQVVSWPSRAHLYYLMSWHAGATLARHLEQGRRFTPVEAADLATRTLKALAALHRLAIVHRDIKPDNLHLGADGRLRLLDLGVAASDGQDAAEIFNEINNPGTPSFMAPELFAGAAANEASDLYAVGVTLYHLLTRKYPYGEIEPFQTPRFGPLAAHRYRPDTRLARIGDLKAVARPGRSLRDRRGISAGLGARRPAPLARGAPHAAVATRSDAGPETARGRFPGSELVADVPAAGALTAYFLACRSIRTLPNTDSATPAVVSQVQANFSKK